jgi:uncharacterized damage-inducible protein DinB
MKRILILLLGGVFAAAALRGQAPTTTSTGAPPTASAPAPAPGFQADYVAEVDSVGKKLVELAEAMPADKYSWRPAPGVRSVGEVYMHVVVADSMIPGFLGAKPMEGVTRDSEKSVTDKAKIVALLQEAIRHARAVGMQVSDADLDRKVKSFGGREMTERAVLLLLLTHMHEHLGQSIAYARMNGITPPWSRAQ